MTKLSANEEEILETLWVKTIQNKKESYAMGVAQRPEIFELSGMNLIRVDSDKLSLTEKGRKIGESIVRRHRLAERLFSDILDLKKGIIHNLSCEFEHLLHEGIEDNICILLGHPKTCPHGQIIPPGKCCRESAKTLKKIVSALCDLEAGEKGRIAYIHTAGNKNLQKIMAMGALPGVLIRLIRKFPTYLFEIGHSQFAVDKSIAEAIFVRIEK